MDLGQSRSVTFNVRVSQGNGDWLVTIDNPDGTEYAKTLCSDLTTALQMAVPYMAEQASPSWFALTQAEVSEHPSREEMLGDG